MLDTPYVHVPIPLFDNENGIICPHATTGSQGDRSASGSLCLYPAASATLPDPGALTPNRVAASSMLRPIPRVAKVNEFHDTLSFDHVFTWDSCAIIVIPLGVTSVFGILTINDCAEAFGENKVHDSTQKSVQNSVQRSALSTARKLVFRANNGIPFPKGRDV